MGRHIQQGITRLMCLAGPSTRSRSPARSATFDGCAYRYVKELASDSDTDTDTDSDSDSQSD
jgi:hypothetical protein